MAVAATTTETSPLPVMTIAAIAQADSATAELAKASGKQGKNRVGWRGKKLQRFFRDVSMCASSG
jgi:hypothetical protein